jgi:protein tyrosine phosphatase (PTP) superfamily phosphohydrolase (DUF442 family)
LRYSDSISLGESPAIRDIGRLAKAGFRALLNLNTEGEPGQRLSPNVEATWAHAFALQHERASIDMSTLGSEGADRFLAALAAIDKPVYVHSLHGQRAAAMLTVHLALEHGLSGQEALAEAQARGLDCELEELRRFVESEVDRRAPVRAPRVVPTRAANGTG